MAKITIAGQALVVTSEVKLEDYKKVAKYRPKALILMGGEDNKTPVFRVAVTNGPGSISKYGVEFGVSTNDDKKLAAVTCVLDETGVENIKECVADSIGPIVMQLGKIEATIPTVLQEIAAEKAAIMENIVVAQ